MLLGPHSGSVERLHHHCLQGNFCLEKCKIPAIFSLRYTVFVYTLAWLSQCECQVAHVAKAMVNCKHYMTAPDLMCDVIGKPVQKMWKRRLAH